LWLLRMNRERKREYDQDCEYRVFHRIPRELRQCTTSAPWAAKGLGIKGITRMPVSCDGIPKGVEELKTGRTSNRLANVVSFRFWCGFAPWCPLCSFPLVLFSSTAVA
jgi:hypothetical protein